MKRRSRWVLTLAIVLVALLAACSPAATSRGSISTSSGASAGTGRAAPRQTTLVALGASDAFGVGTDDPDRQNWPRVLSEELGGPIHLVNLGMPGATLAQAEQIELPVALAAHPDIVVVWLAVNDFADGVSLDTYTAQLTSLLQTLHTRTSARVYVGNLPDLSLLPYFDSVNPTTLQTMVGQWNAAIASICAAQGTHLVDIGSAWSQLADHPEYIASDGLHPSTIGAQKLADLFALTIRQSGAP
jgi:lysophospholipase L1-like esterase